jgi:ADP-ribose pyrophosphatase
MDAKTVMAITFWENMILTGNQSNDWKTGRLS